MRNVIWQLGNVQAARAVIVKGPAASEIIIWDQITLSVVNRGWYYADRLIFQLSTGLLRGLRVSLHGKDRANLIPVVSDDRIKQIYVS